MAKTFSANNIFSNILHLLTQAADPAASANKLLVYAKSIATRRLLTTIDPDSSVTALQPLLARNKAGFWLPQGTSTLPTGIGMTAPLGTGTITGRVPASTNLCTSLRRIGAQSAGGAGSVCGFRGQVLQFWRGNAAGLGGFFFVMRFNNAEAVVGATPQMFAGLRDVTTAPVDAAPSTLTNLIGVGCDSGDTNLQLYAAGAAAQARTSLGAGFPINTVNVDVYELAMYCPPNSAEIQWQVTRVNTGATTSGTVSVAAQLFSNTTFVAPRLWRSNGASNPAVEVDLISCYVETPA